MPNFVVTVTCARRDFDESSQDAFCFAVSVIAGYVEVSDANIKGTL
jgi:hypothetical protein